MTRLKSKEIDNDIINIMKIKSDDKQMKDTRKIEKLLKSIDIIQKCKEYFPIKNKMEERMIIKYLSGDIIGMNIVHIFKENNNNVI